MRPIPKIASLATLLALTACGGGDLLDETGGLKITRSACPAVAIPQYTGDITLFDPPGSYDARAIDVTATITNVRTTCSNAGSDIVATVTFDVLAQRRDAGARRQVVLPYFASVVRAGTRIVSKQQSRVAIDFPAGAVRAQTRGTASSRIAVSEATIPADIAERINRKRKPGDEDAAVDPMSDPAVKAAVANASFELLVGFQLNEIQLRYNATR